MILILVLISGSLAGSFKRGIRVETKADFTILLASMTPSEAKPRHAQLVDEIRQHDHAYYVLAQPSITDQDYDRLYRQLLDLEKQFPDLITPDSPSQRVGGQPLKAFKPVQHLRPMLSLDNTYSQEELREFVA